MFTKRFENQRSLKSSLFISAVPIIALAAVTACSSDDHKFAADGGIDASAGAATGTGGLSGAGSGGHATGTGGATTGGSTSSGGSETGGVSGSGGTRGAGGATGGGGSTETGGAIGSGGHAPDDDAGGVDASAGEADPDASTAHDAAIPSPARLGFAGVTDYSFASFTSVDLKTGEVLQRWATEGNAVAVAHDGVGFVLERNNAVVDTLNHEGLFSTRIFLFRVDAGATYLNPHDVVPIPGTHKAYVSLNGAPNIDIVDTEAGTVTGLIDVSQFTPPGQPHPSADMGAYDPKTNRVYFELQRLNVTGSGCTSWPALVIGIDATNDHIVDINGAADGVAVPLTLAQPTAVALQNDQLYVLDIGCNAPDAGDTYVKQGIEVVDLATGTSKALYRTADQNYGLGLSLLDDTRAVVSRNSLDYSVVLESLWSLGSNTLGASLPNAPPLGAAVETSDTLIGVRQIPVDGGAYPAFVRYRISTGELSVLATDAFALDPTTVSAPAGAVVLR